MVMLQHLGTAPISEPEIQCSQDENQMESQKVTQTRMMAVQLMPDWVLPWRRQVLTERDYHQGFAEEWN